MNLNSSTHNISNKYKVSLTMIVRNEEQNLTHCLESVRGLFDEIVIVDTGSTDNTKTIAAEFGAKIINFTWIEDFSAARNMSLENATCDYAFWLDADDVIDPKERTKLEQLLSNLDANQHVAYVFKCVSGQLVVDHVRLFPLRTDVRWVYRVHEQILPSLERANIAIQWSNISIQHHGYQDPLVKENKRQRDWNILLQELTVHPTNAFVFYNLGMIAFERERWLEALAYFSCSFANLQPSSMGSIRQKLYSMLAWSHQILGNFKESLKFCEIGLRAESDDAELWFRKAIAYRYMHNNSQAESCWLRVLTLSPSKKFISIDQGIYGHLTRRNLAILASERGDDIRAHYQWLKILEECPNDADAMCALEKYF